MIHEIKIAGMLIAPIAGYGLAALLMFLPCRFVLGRTGLLPVIWHPALFEVALFVSILCLLIHFV